MSSLKDKLRSLPNKPGVYLFKSKKGEILYVGKAKALRKRVASYFNKTQDISEIAQLDCKCRYRYLEKLEKGEI